MRGRTAARVGGAIVVSLCVHLSIGRWTPVPPAPVAKSAAPVEVSIVELGSAEKKRPAELQAAPRAAAPQVEKLPPPLKRRARAPSRVEQHVPEVPLAEAEVAVPSPAPEAVAAAAPMPDLSPSAVARSCQTAGLLSMPEQPAARPAGKATDAQLNRKRASVRSFAPYQED